MSELWTHDTIDIDAPADKVWRVLTDPALTKQFMFGCEALSDWKVGSPLLWEGEANGKKMVFVSGIVKTYDRPHRLVYTVFDPNSGIPDKPENHLDARCTLTEKGGKTTLAVDQGDYANVPNGQARYEDSLKQGWESVMGKIKSLAEAL